MIRKHIVADVYRIRAASPYPHDYEQTVAPRNVREQDADARPRIAKPLKSIDEYDVILLGSPIWNVRPPMIILDVHRELRPQRQNDPSLRHVRRQRARHDDGDVQGPVHRRQDHGRSRCARRDGETSRPAGTRMATPHQPRPLDPMTRPLPGGEGRSCAKPPNYSSSSFKYLALGRSVNPSAS